MPRPISPHALAVRLALCLCLLSHPALFRAAAGPGGERKSPAPSVPPAGPAPVRTRRAPQREGELLVRFREGVSEESKAGAAEARGARRTGGLRGESGWERLGLPGGQDPATAAEQWRSLPEVESAEPNYLITADQLAPNDPRFAKQWALRNTGEGGGTAGSDVDAARAWLTTKGSEKTVIAVIDSGVDFTHPELSAGRWANPAETLNGRDDDSDGFADDLHGWDFVTGSGDVKDGGGHGTAVAGLIAARADNGEGVAGVMWRASLMSLRVLDSAGAGDVAAAVEAVDYAVARGAHVINASWGTPAESAALREAVERAWRRGVVVVCSAGNAGQDIAQAPRYPASYDLPNVISVASTDSSDRLDAGSNSGRGVLVAAPGVQLLTTKVGGGYAPVSGASAAAAVVSGVAGLVKSVRPRLKASKVREALLVGARRVQGLEGVVAAGGVVSAASAVELAAALPPDSDLAEGEQEGPAEAEAEEHAERAQLLTAAGGEASEATPAHPGRPERRMPDLDEARGHRPAEPRAVPPVPSTRRRCPPHNPRCNDSLDSPTPPAPTPTPTPNGAALAGRDANLLLAYTAQALLSVAASVINGGRPGFAVPSFDFFRGDGYSVSDAPFAGSPPADSDSARAYYAAAAAPLAQSSGLAAHWEFDEGAAAAAADSTGNGNEGTVNGASLSPGKVGPGALTFDGADDRVNVAGTPGLSAVANNFTIAFWARPESPHQIDAQSTTGYTGTSGQRYAVWPRGGDSAWGAGHAGAGVSVGTNGVSVYEHANGYMPATLVHQAAPTGWTHVAVVYENRQPRLYLDGALVKTGLASPKSYVHAQTTDLGGQVYGYFDGSLDDVRVYDRVLSAGEIASLTSLARVNVALLANGGAAAVSSIYDSTRRASSVINGERTGLGGGDPAVGNWWTDGTPNSYPDWAEVTFAGDETIDEVGVYSLQDNYQTPEEPTGEMTAATYGLIDFQVQYWTGSGWATPPGGVVTGNTKVWRRVAFAPVTTRKIRVLVTAARGSGYSRVVEVEAWRASQQSPQAFVTGRTLGTPRSDAPGWTGMRITTAGRPLSVSSLGRVCVGGSTGSRDLRVVRASDNATVASAAVSLAGCAGGQFVYAPLASPVTLDAYADYLVVSNETGGAYFYSYTGTALTTTPVASVRHGVYTTNGGLTWGAAGVAGNSYVPLDFQYTTAPAAPGTGLSGYYFDDADFTGHKLTRTDAKVDFSWDLSAPAAGMGAEEFSVRWAGVVIPRHSETYTFHTTTDDGVRLWVDGRLLIDRWQDQSATEWSGQLDLVAGREYDVRMEFYDRWHGATARLSWSSPSQPKEVVPQARLYPCRKTADQLVGAFYQGALGRPPTSTELQTWAGRLDSAPDFAALEGEARSLGATLFESAEYAARDRTAREFVYDLHWAYLQRGPEQAAWDYWSGRVAQDGEAGVREALAGEGELAEKVRRLCGISPSNASGGMWGSDFAAARVEPVNRTGGTDAYSRNFNWGLPLVSLPGRAGLDLGLSLSYNSLVWTKDGTSIAFDADRGFPGPGFRLGFPVIQPRFYNPRIQRPGQPARYSYLLITPSGARVELRQVGASNVYESADSSYLRLTDGGGSLLLRSTDGTRLTFSPAAGEYKCVEVKDRNGNYLTISYDYDGQIASVVDTLGRTVSFNYDAYRNLVSISQPWRRADGSGTDPHLYATVGYKNITLQPSFSGLSVAGTAPGAVVPVVERVGLDDGSHYKFEYTAWGQVYRITRYAADSVTATGAADDSHPLSSVEYNLAGARGAAAPAQADCPRFTERREWAENWNGDDGDKVLGDPEQAVTSYSAWSPGLASCQVTLPDRTTVMKETYGTGWAEGLTTQSRVYALPSAGAALPASAKKKTVTTWEQDDQALSFDENPRVSETTVYDDANNRRRTRFEYLTGSEFPFRLLKKVYEYKADAATVWRRSEVDYLGPSITAAGAYTQAGIVGLVKERRLYGLDPYTDAEKLLSKVTYTFDAGGEHLVSPADASGAAVNPARHDPAYGTAYATRGLVTGVRRWDADAPADQTKSVENRVGYDTAGSVVFTADPSGHKATVDYADNFSDGVNRGAYAYPTASADPDQSALAQPKKVLTAYDYDRGLVTKTKDLKDSERTFTYDAANRLKEATTVSNGAKVRYEYPAGMTYVHAYSKVEADKAEGHSWSVLDGAGRVIGSASDHPDPARTAVRYSGQETFYDVMGRAFKQSNPTEIDGTWLPQGDDVATPDGKGGWRYTTQTFDWQGRPLRVTNADGTYLDFSYGGCGCAGGQVVLTRDEVGRRQKVFYDVLGRVAKTQDLTVQAKNLPLSSAADGSDVYRTAGSLYNGRDQAVETLAHAGAAAPTDQTRIQKTTLAYDGHGRLKSRHLPGQTAGKAMTFDYHADDTLWKVTDARGAQATHAYNKRHLVTSITYTGPAGVVAAAGVSYEYDAAGNRTKMTDGQGWASYTFNTLSQVESETRHFSAINRSFTLSYTYTLAGALKSVTEVAFGTKVDYAYDDVGRLSGVSGQGYPQTTQFASAVGYRAWGAPKAMTYGNGLRFSATYTARLQVLRAELKSASNSMVMGAENQYYGDGRLRFSTDLRPGDGPRFDRRFEYDLVGRVKEVYSGAEARGEAVNREFVPLRQTYGYNEFDNLTARSNWHWERFKSFADAYVNDRRQTPAGQTPWEYDDEGNLLYDLKRRYKVDAAGRRVESSEDGATVKQGYDGYGRLISHTEAVTTPLSTSYSYNVRATPLGGEVVAEVTEAGARRRGFLYAAGELLARVEGGEVRWEHRQPATGGRWESSVSLAPHPLTELDPLGADVGTESPYEPGIAPAEPLIFDQGSHWGSRAGSPADPRSGCAVNGMGIPCEVFLRMADDGVLNFLTDDPRGGARPYEAPVRRVGAGSTVWVDLGTRPMPGSGWRERAVGEGEVISSDISLRRMGFFIHLPVGVAAAVTDTPQSYSPPINIEAIVSEVARRWNSPGCAEFIKQSLAETVKVVGGANESAEGGDVLAIFLSIVGGNGKVVRAGGPGSADGGTYGTLAFGSLERKSAVVQLGSYHFHGGRPSAEAIREIDGRMAFDETLHHLRKSKTYFDYDLARGLSKLPGMPELEERPDPYGKDKGYYSDYFHRKVREKCK